MLNGVPSSHLPLGWPREARPRRFPGPGPVSTGVGESFSVHGAATGNTWLRGGRSLTEPPFPAPQCPDAASELWAGRAAPDGGPWPVEIRAAGWWPAA